MKSILPPLIAAVQLIREFVQWVAKLMGVKVVFTDFTKSADSVGGIGDAMDNTTDSTKKAAKALKDYTMGFDELNIIDPTQGSSGSGGGASAGNILGNVDLSGYDMFKQYNEEFQSRLTPLSKKSKNAANYRRCYRCARIVENRRFSDGYCNGNFQNDRFAKAGSLDRNSRC